MKQKLLLLSSFFLINHSFAVTIEDLETKSIFRTFYPSMFHATFESKDEEEIKLPHIGIEENSQEYLAILHPAEVFKNNSGEDRYLIFVEKREIGKAVSEIENGKLVEKSSNFYEFSEGCHACEGNADLMIFKKNNQGNFDLVSKNINSYTPPSQYGIINLNIENLASRIVKIGKNDVGFFDDSYTYSNDGGSDTLLHLIKLGDDAIQGYNIDIVEGSNEGTYDQNSPLNYSFKGEYRVKTDQPDLKSYPIEIKFKGDILDEKTDKFVKYNKIKTYQFNNSKNTYSITSEKSY